MSTPLVNCYANFKLVNTNLHATRYARRRKCDEVDVFIVKEIEKSENDDSLLGRVWSKKIDDLRGNEIEDLF